MNIRASFFKPGAFLQVVTDRPYTISVNDAFYEQAVEAYKAKNYEDMLNFMSRPRMIAKYSAGAVKVFDGVVMWNGKEVHNYISNRILQFLTEGIDLGPIVNFLNDLMNNPEERVKESLFRFLEVNELALTEDGGFLAYKLTQSNGRPYYQTNSDIVYSVGAVPEMPREEVSTDPAECGGPGLYFGNKGYWNRLFDKENRYIGDGKMFLVKIMPSWVVSIPHIEAKTKGRAYKMEVIAEYETVRETVHANRVVEATAENEMYGEKPSGQKFYNVRGKGGKFVKKTN